MIELVGLSHTYRAGAAPALAGVSLSIRPGERVALLGPSGAGKSTLLRCINGLVRPTSGEILFEGRRVTGLADSDLQGIRRKMAMIFQQFHLIESYTAQGNALAGAFGRHPFWRSALGLLPESEVRLATRSLERVGLGGLARTPVRELSGGQRQRVAIARALVQGARVLLGDEPVASLDPGVARAVMELLLALNQQDGLTLVLSLHDPNLALSYCDRVIALRAGRVLFDQPAAAVTPADLAAVYALDGTPVAEGPAVRSLAPVAVRCRP